MRKLLAAKFSGLSLRFADRPTSQRAGFGAGYRGHLATMALGDQRPGRPCERRELARAIERRVELTLLDDGAR